MSTITRRQHLALLTDDAERPSQPEDKALQPPLRLHRHQRRG